MLRSTAWCLGVMFGTAACSSSAPDSQGSETCPSAPVAPTGAQGLWFDRTTGTQAAAQHWTAVRSDSSGTQVFAASTIVLPSCLHGGAWASTDVGQSWTYTSGGPLGAHAIASSTDGSVLVAAGESLWISKDWATTWDDSTTPKSLDGWASAASDTTGTQLAAAAAYGDIWTSSDGGATWTNRTPSGPAHDQYWVAMMSDSTGTKLVALTGGDAVAGPGTTGDIWTSTDAGVTWTDRTTTGATHDLAWAGVAGDSTGTHLVAVEDGVVGNGVWTSNDSGVTWTAQTVPAGVLGWNAVASDATGALIPIAASGAPVNSSGDLYTSTDGGVTWTNETAGTSGTNRWWRGVASDATGENLFAVEIVGDVWTRCVGAGCAGSIAPH